MLINKIIKLGFTFSRFKKTYTAIDKNMDARGDFSKVIEFTINPKTKNDMNRLLYFILEYIDVRNREAIIPKGINNDRNQ
tara:strand:+ start:5034 stop:5273 length:240 start_codon:yes stop_codon:yes gene_type:complete